MSGGRISPFFSEYNLLYGAWFVKEIWLFGITKRRKVAIKVAAGRFCLPRWEEGLYIDGKTRFKAVSKQRLRLL